MSFYRDVGTPHMGSMTQDTRGPTAAFHTGVGRVTGYSGSRDLPQDTGQWKPIPDTGRDSPKVLTTVPHASRHTAGMPSCLGESLLPVALDFLHLRME